MDPNETLRALRRLVNQVLTGGELEMLGYRRLLKR